jgi:hypothetical protein
MTFVRAAGLTEDHGKAVHQGRTVRKLVVTQNITVDGSIEMLGDWFDPQGQSRFMLTWWRSCDGRTAARTHS